VHLDSSAASADCAVSENTEPNQKAVKEGLTPGWPSIVEIKLEDLEAPSSSMFSPSSSISHGRSSAVKDNCPL